MATVGLPDRPVLPELAPTGDQFLRADGDLS